MGKPTLIFIIILLLATAGTVIYVRNPRPFKIAWASVVAGDIEHYLPCYELPFYSEVEKALQQHQDIADRIKSINGVTGAQPELVKCYTLDGSNYFVKGDILIEYENRNARKEVERLVGDNFFGIPFRGHKQ